VKPGDFVVLSELTNLWSLPGSCLVSSALLSAALQPQGTAPD